MLVLIHAATFIIFQVSPTIIRKKKLYVWTIKDENIDICGNIDPQFYENIGMKICKKICRKYYNFPKTWEFLTNINEMIKNKSVKPICILNLHNKILYLIQIYKIRAKYISDNLSTLIGKTCYITFIYTLR